MACLDAVSLEIPVPEAMKLVTPKYSNLEVELFVQGIRALCQRGFAGSSSVSSRSDPKPNLDEGPYYTGEDPLDRVPLVLYV